MPQSQDPKTIAIDPYQTTVPLVPLQVPQAADSAPRNSASPPAYFGKSTGIATIGDSLLRGFLQGHAQKEARKYAQASAAINAGQAAEQSAYQTYQDSIVAGKSPDEQKALYDNYAGIYQKNTEAMQQFAVPEKKSKSKDGAKPKGEGKDKTQGQGFGGKIKDFMEANPHLVPQIAILTRSAGMKQPGLSPEGQAKQLELKAAQQQSATADEALATAQQKRKDMTYVSQFSSLTPEQVQALPPEQQKELAAAKSRLEMAGVDKGAKYQLFEDGAGNQVSIREGEPIPTGYKLVNTSKSGQKLFVDSNGGFHYAIPGNEEKGWSPFVPSAMPKPGSQQYALQKFLEGRSKTFQTATNEDIEAFNQQTAKDKQPTGKTVSTSTTDEHGNRTTVTTKERGGISAPPKGSTAPQKRAAGPITPPPGRKTLTDANREEKRTADQQKGTAAAYKEYTDKIASNGAKYGGDTASLQAANKAAQDAYHAKIWQNEKNFHRGDKMTQAKDAKGIIYGSFDGKNFFNVATGQPYQGQ